MGMKCKIYISFSLFLTISAFIPWNWGAQRDHKETRYASMIDTFSNAGHAKSGYYFNTNGLFRDEITGKVFSDSINDSLYRQFERDGNQPIRVSWPYSLDKMEGTSIGFFARGLAVLMWVASAAFACSFFIEQYS